MSRMLRFALVLFVLALPAAASAANSTSPPNVVMIIADDQAWTDYGFMGHPEIHTPHLDRLAREGLVFTRGYVAHEPLPAESGDAHHRPVPASARHHFGNDPPGGSRAATMLRQRESQIAHIDRAADAPAPPRSARLSLASDRQVVGGRLPPRRFHPRHDPRRPARGGRHGDEGLKIGREGAAADLRIHRSKRRRQAVLRLVCPDDAAPAAHAARAAAGEIRGQDRLARTSPSIGPCASGSTKRAASCSTISTSKGLAENTSSSTSPTTAGSSNPDAPGHAPRVKRSPYDGGMRTPIMFRWPGQLEPRLDKTHARQQHRPRADDPRRLRLRCAARPAGHQPCTTRAAVAARPAIFGQTFTHNAVDVTRPAANLEYRWVLEGLWKLILPNPANVPGGKPELHDVLADPREENDRAAAEPEGVKDLFVEIENWWPAR